MSGYDIKIILHAPKKVVDDPAKKAAELEAKKLANQKLAQRFVMPLSSDQTRLTFERYPDLKSAYNGTFAGELDLRNIRVISPERVDRAVGPYIDPASQRAAQRAREVREANDPARAMGRAFANAYRGRNFDNSKG